MKITNRTNEITTQIQKTGSIIEFSRVSGDDPVFDTSLHLQCNDDTGFSTYFSGITQHPTRLGVILSGVGTGVASISPVAQLVDPTTPFCVKISFIVKTRSSYIGKVHYEVELDSTGYFLETDFEDGILTLKAFSTDTLVIPVNNGDATRIDLYITQNVAGECWTRFDVNGVERLVQIAPRILNGFTGYFLGGLNAVVDALNEGHLLFYGFGPQPVLLSDIWMDASSARMPLCVSYSDGKAVFLCRPISPGITTTARLYGANWNLAAQASLEDLELILDDHRKDKIRLMPSQVEKIYTDEIGLLVCPIQGNEISSRTDAYITNECFEDDSDRLSDGSLTIRTSTSGELRDVVHTPEFVMEYDGNRYGKDVDLNQLHTFHTAIDSTSFPGVNFTPTGEISPVTGEYRVVRSQKLSDGKILYYGFIAEAPQTDVELFDINIDLASLNFKRLNVDRTEASGSNFFISVEKIGDPSNPILPATSVATPYTDTINIRVERGSYKVKLRATEVNFHGFYGAVWVRQRNPSGSVDNTITRFISSEAERSFDTETEVYFDVNTNEGKIFWMLFDPATSSMIRMTQTEASYDYRCDGMTNSISCLDHGDSFSLIYKEYDTTWPSPPPELKYRRYSYQGEDLTNGSIMVSDPGEKISSIKCFDAVSTGDAYAFYMSFYKNRVETRATSTPWLDARYYSYRPVQSDAFPAQDHTISIMYKSKSAMKFELDEYIVEFNSSIQLGSLNYMFPAYSTSGISASKGNALDVLDYKGRPNYKTSPSSIRANANEELDIVVLSVIDTRQRHGLIFAGKETYREVAIPEVFDTCYSGKDEGRAIASLDACWYNDGKIYAVATTFDMPYHLHDGITPFTVDANDPLYELCVIPTDILESAVQTYLEIDIGKNWYEWTNLSAFRSKHRQVVVPILNTYDNTRTYTPTYDIGAGEVPSPNLADTKFPGSPRINGLSIRTERGMLVYCSASSNAVFPHIYYSHRADRLPFKLPLEEMFMPNAAYLNNTITRYPGKLHVASGNVITTPKTNHINITGTDNSVVLIDYDYTTPSTLNRSFCLDKGSRFKVTIDISEIDVDGIRIDYVDSYADPAETSYPLTTTYGQGCLHIYKQSGLIRFRHFYLDSGEVTVGIITYPFGAPDVVDIHGTLRRISEDKIESTFIIKPNLILSGTKAASLFNENEKYGNRIVDDIYRSTTVKPIPVPFATSPRRQLRIYNYNEAAQTDNYKIYSIGMGVLSHEESAYYTYDSAVTPYNPRVTSVSKTGYTPFQLSDTSVGIDSLTKTTFGFPMKAHLYGRTPTLYWNQGFEFRPNGSTTKIGDAWTLERERLSSVESLKSGNIHGLWLSNSDMTNVKIWAAAADSERDKFKTNMLIVDGANFRYFYVIGRNSEVDPWERVRLVDLRTQGYEGLSYNQNPNRTSAYTLSKNTDTIMPVGLPIYGETTETKVRVSSIGDDFISVDVKADPMLTTSSLTLIGAAIAIDQNDSYAYYGIEIPEQETYSGYYSLVSFDFGWASELGFGSDVTDSSGKSLNYEVNSVLGSENSPQDFSYKNVSSDIGIDYTATDIRSMTRIRSITEKLSKNHRPVWYIGSDDRDPDLCFISSDPTYRVIIDDSGQKTYKVTLNLKRVK